MPTKNGELWLFGKHYTHYMPVAIFELKAWLGEPAIYVLDCSCAGALLPHFVDSKTMKDSMIFCEREMQNKAPRDPDGSVAFAAAYDGMMFTGTRMALTMVVQTRNWHSRRGTRVLLVDRG